jgi:hypothetical protein
MKQKLKQPFYDIALATGGSHYPDVGGALLQQFGQQVVQRCIELADTATAQRIAQEFNIDLEKNYETSFRSLLD